MRLLVVGAFVLEAATSGSSCAEEASEGFSVEVEAVVDDDEDETNRAYFIFNVSRLSGLLSDFRLDP